MTRAKAGGAAVKEGNGRKPARAFPVLDSFLAALVNLSFGRRLSAAREPAAANAGFESNPASPRLRCGTTNPTVAFHLAEILVMIRLYGHGDDNIQMYIII